MDPGTALGAVSLIFQVFTGCIKGYQLLSAARGLDKDLKFLRIRFKSEQYRLLNWAQIAQLSENDDSLAINRASRTLLLDVLDQQYRLIFRFGRLDDRLRPLSKPLLASDELEAGEDGEHGHDDEVQGRFPTTNALLKKSLSFVQKTSRFPASLRWVLSDKAKIEELLGKLTSLNDYLDQLLSSQQMELLNSQQTRTNYQILQLNNKVDELCELVRAGMLQVDTARGQQLGQYLSVSALSASLWSSQPLAEDAPLRRVEGNIVQLAQAKALVTAAESGPLRDLFRSELQLESYSATGASQSPELSETEIQLVEDIQEHQNPSFAKRTTALYKPSFESWRSVWVEWKDLPHTTGPDQLSTATLKRFEALICLLREDKCTRQFRALRCLGYYVHGSPPGDGPPREAPRYGLVYENPEGVDAKARPVSLMAHMLETSRAEKVPSLSSRIALMGTLAEAVERLHAVNWLHKGLRSENVLFFARDLVSPRQAATSLDLRRPYLTGFDYSRPANEQYRFMSESAPESAAEDLYRHPAVQGLARGSGVRAGYKKKYDIYSLGILLLEIAFWKPIFRVLGFANAEDVKAKDASQAKDKLLDGDFDVAGWLRSHLGDTVSDVIVSCLAGPVTFGILGAAAEEEGVELQKRFFDVVVKRLQNLRI